MASVVLRVGNKFIPSREIKGIGNEPLQKDSDVIDEVLEAAEGIFNTVTFGLFSDDSEEKTYTTITKTDDTCVQFGYRMTKKLNEAWDMAKREVATNKSNETVVISLDAVHSDPADNRKFADTANINKDTLKSLRINRYVLRLEPPAP